MYSNQCRYPQAALEKIVRYFHRLDSPLYTGYVSIEIGYSIKQTEEMIDHLIESGVLKRLTDDEKKMNNIDVCGSVCSLVNKAKISRASPGDIF